MKRELVFTAYNRTEYFRQVIDSWNMARNLKLWNTTVYLEPSDVQTEMSAIAFDLQTTVTVYNNPVKLGVLINPWNALNNAFLNGADFVVLAEDDTIVSQDVLEYFEWGSEEYNTAQDVLCLNAFSRIGGGKTSNLFRQSTFSPLVWGVWKDRWDTLLKDSWDKDYSSGNEDGSEAGWDWNINRILQNQNMTVIKPLHSRSDHIGEFDGTHMTPDQFESSKGIDFSQIRGRSRYIEV